MLFPVYLIGRPFFSCPKGIWNKSFEIIWLKHKAHMLKSNYKRRDYLKYRFYIMIMFCKFTSAIDVKISKHWNVLINTLLRPQTWHLLVGKISLISSHNADFHSIVHMKCIVHSVTENCWYIMNTNLWFKVFYRITNSKTENKLITICYKTAF